MITPMSAAEPRPRTFWAPGRVNLIGEHTDYSGGLVLPVALDLGVTLRVTRVGGPLRVTSSDGDAQRYAEAVAAELAARGFPVTGLEATITTTLPIGAGLSSSAALGVALGLALTAVPGEALRGLELAEVAQHAETRATGVPCGIMDQLVAVAGREGCALFVDCRSLETRTVPLPASLGLLVVHSGQARALADSAYSERRRACEELARRLGLPALRDATAEQVADEPLGRHVVSENARVLAAACALEEGDLAGLGALLSESHASLRDDFRVSTPELDELVRALVAAGAHGARLTGAGFGGSVVAACDVADAERVAEVACAGYRERTGLDARAFVCRAVDGAGLMEPVAS
jgi:galactokinase